MTISSARQPDNSLAEDAWRAAEQLAPAEVLLVTEVLRKGGNNRIHKVVTTGPSFALKRYAKPTPEDPRNRLETEARALSGMRRYGFSNIPAMVATDPLEFYGLLSWCEGESMIRLGNDDITGFAQFLIALDEMSRNIDTNGYAPASEACVSGQAILAHIGRRLKKLKPAAESHAGLARFLDRQLRPFLAAHAETAQRAVAALGLAFDRPIERARQTLIPSDFGSHNALRSKNGLVFLDFEYFGWDDPATSAANFILHPAMTLLQEEKDIFLEAMQAHFGARDETFTARLRALLPLYAARWAAIVLGEFTAGHWEHRLESGLYRREEREAVLERQLAKVEALFEPYSK